MRSRAFAVLVACGLLVVFVAWLRSGPHGGSADAGPSLSGPTATASETAPARRAPHAEATRQSAGPTWTPPKPAPAWTPGVASVPGMAGPHYGPGQVPSPGPAGPGPLPLRLAVANGAPWLAPPGLAIDRGSLILSSGSPLSFDSERLRRPVTISGASALRLHLTRSGSGDVQLTVTVGDVHPDGSVTTLASTAATVPAAVADAGPKSNADIAVPTRRATIRDGDLLRLTVANAGVGLDSVTLYWGALPGEDESNSTADQLDEAKGGPNPSRFTVPVTERTGAFQPY